MKHRRSTSTSNFGVGTREGHDSTAFYDRFRAPDLSTDDVVAPPTPVAEPFVLGDSRDMSTIADASVALVVTSPPYFVGKQYEEELEREGIPRSYLEYLQMLTDVFRECVRTLEPGGRIAVNVANLGRKPYRSLSADVIRILEHDLGLLLRGELIWQKGEGASGSCAWGSFRGASNPVLRDVTERVIIASKGRFDRARDVRERAAQGLPHVSTIMTDEFLSATLDVWSMQPESAKRVGHPAPFPVDLPEQLINLYTFENDLVLDPFMGSGSTMVAASRLGRRYVGYDLDPAYIEMARRRVERSDAEDDEVRHESSDAVTADALVAGKAAPKLAGDLLEAAGFSIVAEKRAVARTGVKVRWVAADADGAEWLFDVAGPLTTRRGGLSLTETVWRALGRAHAIRGRKPAHTPLVLLTTSLPKKSSEGDLALRAAGPDAFFDIVDLLDADGRERLAGYAKGGSTNRPAIGFWRAAELTSWRDP